MFRPLHTPLAVQVLAWIPTCREKQSQVSSTSISSFFRTSSWVLTRVGPSLSSPFATRSTFSATVIRHSFSRQTCRVCKFREGFFRRVTEHYRRLGQSQPLVRRASTVAAALLWEVRYVLGIPQAQASLRPGSSRGGRDSRVPHMAYHM